MTEVDCLLCAAETPHVALDILAIGHREVTYRGFCEVCRRPAVWSLARPPQERRANLFTPLQTYDEAELRILVL